ncbi:MAG: chemotaxis protein CheW [Phycisphaeraceae bacterium]|nr:chemotaxis protein CheW [Phycisphaeraceae bacterium]
MTNASLDNTLWVIVQLKNTLYAITANQVQGIVLLPRVSPVPNTPPTIRGMLNLRGQVMPVIDARKLLNMVSLDQETDQLIDLLTQKEEDHKKWIHELEQSILENRPFKLATNPHQCAFGKWYDTFKTDNLLLTALLQKFAEPHARIHGIAEKVTALAKNNQIDEARKIIEHTRHGDLVTMIRLFEDLRAHLRETIREIAILLEVAGATFALAVDAVETISQLATHEVEDIREQGFELGKDSPVVTVAKLPASKRLVLVLDETKLFTP